MTIKVAVDLTALLGPKTGVGLVAESIATRLCDLGWIEPTGVLVSWRGMARFADQVPYGWDRRRLALPARACHRLWRSTDRPAISGFDVVHGLNYVVPPAAGGRELVTVHDLTAWRYPELVDVYSKRYPDLLTRAIARGAHVHAGSHFVANELVEDLGLDPDRVHATPWGCPKLSIGNAAVAQAMVGSDYLLSIGTIEPRKDYVGLVKAMDLVWDVLPELRLVIAGRAGWGADALREAIDACRRPEQIVVTGYVSDQTRSDLLAGCQAIVYPSLYEGFGFPVLEAMSAAIPVVTTSAGSIPEVAGSAAVLVPPGQSIELAEAVTRVVLDCDLRAELVAAGLQQTKLFSWDTTVVAVEEIYRLLTEKAENAGIGVYSVDSLADP